MAWLLLCRVAGEDEMPEVSRHGQHDRDSEGPDPTLIREVLLAISRIEFDQETGPRDARRARSRQDRRSRPTEDSRAGTARFVSLPVELAEKGLEVWPLPESLPPPTAPGQEGRTPEFIDLSTPPSPEEVAILARDAPSPRLAAVLAVLAPGLGHLYAGAWVTAVTLLSCVVGAAVAGRALLVRGAEGTIAGPLEPWVLCALGLALLITATVSFIRSVPSAYRAAASATPHGRPRWNPRPTVAALASVVVPGLGQVLNGQPIKGAVFMPSAPALVAACSLAAPGASTAKLVLKRFYFLDLFGLTCAVAAVGVVALIAWVVSVYDASLVAAQRRRGRARPAPAPGQEPGPPRPSSPEQQHRL